MTTPVQKIKRIRKQQPPEQSPQRLPLPDEKRVEEHYQAEIVEIDKLTNQIRMNQSLSNIQEVISISQVYSDLGKPITDIRFLNGGVINVYKYHNHTEYFLGGNRNAGVRRQTFEEKSAVVAEYSDPNFTMWLWETDERVQIHYKMLKLNGEYAQIEPQRFINSVVKLRYVVGGYPFSATLEEFRPQEPELPPPEPNFPPLEPKISPAVSKLSPPKPYLPPSERELPLPRSEVLPQEEEKVEEHYQAEIVEIDKLTNQIRMNQSLSNIQEVISISQVYSDLGKPITDIRFLNGGVINVYKYHNHTEYFLGGNRNAGFRRQTFEEKLAIVAEYSDPNFTMWLLETDERVQIHYKMLKLNGEYAQIEPERFINSVVKLRYVVGGYPFSATLEEFRPREPELPPSEPNFPPLEPKISPAVSKLSHPKPYLSPSERELPLPRSEVLPQEEEKVEFYQAEIVKIDQLTNQINLMESLSKIHEVISISEVFSELGKPITDIRHLNVGVINVYKYHDRTEYFLGGTIGTRVRRQTFEEKLAIVENYTDPNFTMWLWETDERVQVHYKMLKLNGEYAQIEPERFINSVVKLRYVVGGHPFSATLEQFRPKEPELPPPEPDLPLPSEILQPEPNLLPSEPELPLSRSKILPQDQMPVESMLEIWKQIGGSLCDYIVHLTFNPDASDLKFITEIGDYLEKCNDPYATKLSEKFKICAKFIDGKTEMQLLCNKLKEQPPMQQSKSNIQIDEIRPHKSSALSHIQSPPKATRPSIESQNALSDKSQSPAKILARPAVDNQNPFPPQPQYPAQPQVRPPVDSHSSFAPQPQYPAQSQARPDVPYQPPRYAVPKCHLCGAEIQLYPFCSHELCRSCIIRSVFALKCLSCKASVQHVPILLLKPLTSSAMDAMR